MSIFSRISDIISSNVNALLDKAEDPERMIAQIIREMEDGLGRAKQFGATAIAAERRIGRELDYNRTQAVHWKSKAREALACNREDMARRALIRKHEHDDLVKSLESQYAAARETGDSVRTSLRALEARLSEARRKQSALLARNRAARVRAEFNRLTASGIPDLNAPWDKFNRLEDRLLDFEDEVAARAEIQHPVPDLSAEFAELETDQQVDDELAAMRAERDADSE